VAQGQRNLAKSVTLELKDGGKPSNYSRKWVIRSILVLLAFRDSMYKTNHVDNSFTTTKCDNCGRELNSKLKYCPGCAVVNVNYEAPIPKPSLDSYKNTEAYKLANDEYWRKFKKKMKIWAIVLAVFFLLLTIGLHNHKKNADSAQSSTASTTSDSTSWIPSGYSNDPKINPDIAFSPVPSSPDLHCTWCSATHGFNFWKVNLVSKSDCQNFYMVADIYNANKQLEKSWYQKGGFQAAGVPFQLEIDTNDPQSTYEITTLTCGGA